MKGFQMGTPLGLVRPYSTYLLSPLVVKASFLTHSVPCVKICPLPKNLLIIIKF